MRKELRNQAYSSHFKKRVQQRFDMILTHKDLDSIAYNIAHQIRSHMILSQPNSRNLYQVMYKTKSFFVIYDLSAKKVVTAFSDKRYFQRIKLLEVDKHRILNKQQRAILYSRGDNSISLRPGRKIKLFVKGEDEPFAIVTIVKKRKMVISDLCRRDYGMEIQSLEDSIKYLTDRYKGTFTGKTKIKVAIFDPENIKVVDSSPK